MVSQLNFQPTESKVNEVHRKLFTSLLFSYNSRRTSMIVSYLMFSKGMQRSKEIISLKIRWENDYANTKILL